MLYVEGRTDLDVLRALARRLHHRAAACWDERINAFYVQDNSPNPDLDAELERVEGGFGVDAATALLRAARDSSPPRS